MKKVKYLTIHFKNDIAFHEIPKFRGAVISSLQHDNVLFHNHQDGGFRYAYPLIQYKQVGQRACLVCLEEGVHEVHGFFQSRPTELRLGDRTIVPEVDRLQMHEVTLQVWDKMFPYRISNWLALNEEHFREYQLKTDQADRVRFLTSILRGNILSMAKGLGWFIETEVKVNLTKVAHTRLIRYKDTRFSAFDVQFECNVSLPSYIGLGKGSALGYGVVDTARTRIHHEKSQVGV
jgi:Cas6b C-terminal domain/Cas6b N-terminal domain